MNAPLSLAPYLAELDRISPMQWTGQVTQVVGENRTRRWGRRFRLPLESREPRAVTFRLGRQA